MNPNGENHERVNSPTPSGGESRGVRVKVVELRGQLQSLGMTTAGLARQAKVSRATISNALNGRRIQPSTFRAIAKALAESDRIPGADALIDREGVVGTAEERMP
ncbi:MAG: helix-turn-helix transcriptional regulator [Candidatus Dormibacteraeota bacterium]|nr:helix-turn-helix transcriptional regulator [Candidatus Dormibacteraeota bacterium]